MAMNSIFGELAPPPERAPEAPHERAVFIDKDGTLVENVPYNVDPAQLRLTPHALEGLALLQQHGFRLIEDRAGDDRVAPLGECGRAESEQCQRKYAEPWKPVPHEPSPLVQRTKKERPNC